MDKRAKLLQLIPEQGILPLFYDNNVNVCLDLLDSLYSAGIRAVEFVHRGGMATENFSELLKVRDTQFGDLFLGIGTIKTPSQAQEYIDLGTDFIVSPGIIKSVGKLANEAKILFIPGCMTPSDIIKAEVLGARLIKLFPGNTLGPGFLEAVKPVFPDLLFMPTGGIELTRENMGTWLRAGVAAFGGSKLITKSIIESKQYSKLTTDFRQALELFKSTKEGVLEAKI